MQQLNESPYRNMLTTALFMLIAIVPAMFIGEVALLTSNHTIGAIVFFSILAADLLGVCWWFKRRTATRQRDASRSTPEVHMTVHAFVAHVKMHPELLPPGMTEIDLEDFRKEFSSESQEDLHTWVEWARQLLHQTWR